MVHTIVGMEVPDGPVNASGSGLAYVSCSIGLAGLSAALYLYLFFPEELPLARIIAIFGTGFLVYGLIALKNDREFKKKYREVLYRQEQAKANQQEYETADIVPESESIQTRQETDFSDMEELEDES